MRACLDCGAAWPDIGVLPGWRQVQLPEKPGYLYYICDKCWAKNGKPVQIDDVFSIVRALKGKSG